MNLFREINHALKVMTKKDKAMVLGINFLGGCLGPNGMVCATLWTIGYVAKKSKEVDYSDPVFVRVVMHAHEQLNKGKK